MATAGPSAPGTTANETYTGSAWGTPDNAKVADDTYTTVGILFVSDSDYLNVYNYGFSIPTGATIDGVTVDVHRKANFDEATKRIRDSTLHLRKAGTRTGTNKAATTTNWPTAEATATYGGAADLWGNTLAPADINNSGFGVSLKVVCGSAFSVQTAYVDYIAITINYTEGGGGGLSIPVAMQSYRQRRV